MKSEELFELLVDLDEEKLAEAGVFAGFAAEECGSAKDGASDRTVIAVKNSGKKRQKILIRWASLAACFCLVTAIAGPALFSDKLNNKQAEVSEMPAAAAADTETNAAAVKEVHAAPEEPERGGAPAVKPGGGPSENPAVEKSYDQKLKTGEDTPDIGVGEPQIEPSPETNQPYFTNDPDIDVPAPGEVSPGMPVQHGFFMTENQPAPDLKGKNQISRYGEMQQFAGDKAVYNGGVEYSQPLANALAAEGSSVTYRVLIEVFKDGVQVPIDSKLIEGYITGLVKEGYTVVIETVSNNFGESSQSYLTLHADADQLADFSGSPDYGFYLMFYDEYFGSPQGPDVPEGMVFHSAEMKN